MSSQYHRGQQILLFLLIIYTSADGVSSEGINEFGPGPQNITRTEGDKNVFFPCPYYFGPFVPIWLINGLTYNMFSVPQSYIAYPSGLVVTTVTREMNGTTFQCYIEIALEPFSSTIGTLTVIAGVDDAKVRDLHVSTCMNAARCLVLDHQCFLFTATNKLVAWIYRPGQTHPPRVTYNVTGINCTSVVVYEQTTRDTNITIPPSDLNSDLSDAQKTYFNISTNVAPCQMCGIRKYIWIGTNVTTLTRRIDPHQNVCIQVPFSELIEGENLFVIWPNVLTKQDRKNPNNAGDIDCACQISRFLHFESCGCLTNSRTFDVVLVGNETENIMSPNYTICWLNIDPVKQMNNTHIHFISEYLLCEGVKEVDISDSLELNSGIRWKYLQSFVIIINGSPPSPPNVTVNGTTLTVCSDDLNKKFPVKSYNVTITDVTGEVVKMQNLTRAENMTCTQYKNTVNDLKPDVCSPFTVKVWALSPEGWSNSSNGTINGDVSKDSCVCMKTKVDFNITVVKTKSDRLQVQFSCSNSLAIGSKTKITTDVKRANRPPSEVDKPNCAVIGCGDTTPQNFINLKRSTLYVISATWNDSCLIKKIEKRTSYFDAILPGKSKAESLVIVILSPVAAVVLLIGIFVITSFLCSKSDRCPCNEACRKIWCCFKSGSESHRFQ